MMMLMMNPDDDADIEARVVVIIMIVSLSLLAPTAAAMIFLAAAVSCEAIIAVMETMTSISSLVGQLAVMQHRDLQQERLSS